MRFACRKAILRAGRRNERKRAEGSAPQERSAFLLTFFFSPPFFFIIRGRGRKSLGDVQTSSLLRNSRGKNNDLLQRHLSSLLTKPPFSSLNNQDERCSTTRAPAGPVRGFKRENRRQIEEEEDCFHCFFFSFSPTPVPAARTDSPPP